MGREGRTCRIRETEAEVRHVNKRQRKKRRIGEFVEFGLEISGTLVPNADSDKFFDVLITEVERLGMCCAGMIGPEKFECLLLADNRKGRKQRSLTEQDRDAIDAFLMGAKDVNSYDVGHPTVDVNR